MGMGMGMGMGMPSWADLLQVLHLLGSSAATAAAGTKPILVVIMRSAMCGAMVFNVTKSLSLRTRAGPLVLPHLLQGLQGLQGLQVLQVVATAFMARPRLSRTSTVQ